MFTPPGVVQDTFGVQAAGSGLAVYRRGAATKVGHLLKLLGRFLCVAFLFSASDRLASACHGDFAVLVRLAACSLPCESPLCLVQSPRFAAFSARVQWLHQLTFG